MATDLTNIQAYEEFVQRQLAIQTRLRQIAEQVREIDRKSGEEIIAALGSIGLQSIGIPIKVPSFLAYGLLGPIGFIFSVRKQNKLKPLYAEIRTLQAQYNVNAETYNQAQTDIVTKEVIKQNSELLFGGSGGTGNGSGSGTSTGGIGDMVRNANLGSTEWLLIIVVIALLFFLYNKSKKKK